MLSSASYGKGKRWRLLLLTVHGLNESTILFGLQGLAALAALQPKLLRFHMHLKLRASCVEGRFGFRLPLVRDQPRKTKGPCKNHTLNALHLNIHFLAITSPENLVSTVEEVIEKALEANIAMAPDTTRSNPGCKPVHHTLSNTNPKDP